MKSALVFRARMGGLEGDATGVGGCMARGVDCGVAVVIPACGFQIDAGFPRSRSCVLARNGARISGERDGGKRAIAGASAGN